MAPSTSNRVVSVPQLCTLFLDAMTLHSSAYHSQKLLWTLKAHLQYVFPAPRLQLLNLPKQRYQMELTGDMFTQPPQWLLWYRCFITEPANINSAKWMSAEGMGTEDRRTRMWAKQCEYLKVKLFLENKFGARWRNPPMTEKASLDSRLLIWQNEYKL